MKILLTGGCGFIGSNTVRWIMRKTGHHVVNVDKLTYAGNPESLRDVAGDSRHTPLRLDICDARQLREAFEAHDPDAVLHLAAESHVDRSIDSPAAFIHTNLVGTYTVLEASRRHWESLGATRREQFRLIHVSTDEVFGSLGSDAPAFSETTAYDPRSPYSASKAGSDHLVRAWHHTYGLPTIVTNCSNNYGPYHFPEKLIPLVILNAIEGKPLPIYGTGDNVRDWLYVEDHAGALLTVLERGVPGESYLVGGDSERTNLEVVRLICDILDEVAPLECNHGIVHRGGLKSYRDLIKFVPDRPGHDKRYAIDASRIRRDLGWKPAVTFEAGLRATVVWYLDNRWWWEPIRQHKYQGNRLGNTSVKSDKQA